MALPQTASLALSGPLPLPGLLKGRAWFTAFDDRGELLQVCWIRGSLTEHVTKPG